MCRCSASSPVRRGLTSSPPVPLRAGRLLAVVLLVGWSAASPLAGQGGGPGQGSGQPVFGPVIHSAGPVFEIPAPEFETPLNVTYRVAFDLATGSTSAEELNQGLNSVARFLNMHARAGVPLSRLQVAVVIHGTAAKDFLEADAFRTYAGFDNPNLDLIDELAGAGVRFVMCGQSLGARGIPREGLLTPVQVALSAMTAHLVLQAEGYRINPF